LRRDITCTCSCPDDDNWDGHACKHVVATLYTLSNEFLIEPDLVDMWRGNDADDSSERQDSNDTHRHTDRDRSEDDEDDTPSSGRRRHLSLVRDGADVVREPAAPVAVIDSLASVLRLQPGTELPEIPSLERADLRPPKDRELAAVLRDALQHVRVDWD
jgi:uncharacterized Zn finger protein